MAKFMKVESALARLVEDEGATVADRVRALRLLPHPALCMLRRLLHRSRTEPARVPARLLAAATLAFAKEIAFRKMRPARVSKKSETGNALGIEP
jgi:hypothetical protein